MIKKKGIRQTTRSNKGKGQQGGTRKTKKILMGYLEPETNVDGCKYPREFNIRSSTQVSREIVNMSRRTQAFGLMSRTGTGCKSFSCQRTVSSV